MKRPLKPDEVRIWSLVAATVHPLPGRETPKAEPLPSPSGEGQAAKRPGLGGPVQVTAPTGQAGATARLPHTSGAAGRPPAPDREGKGIEPRRKHRITKERDPIWGRIDLHGMTQDRARGELERFLRDAWADGGRAVLVITGKGFQGDGVLRRHTPEWLAAPGLAHIVAGISEAHRRHGGEGALYVALKRKPRG